ncbi:MAG: superoxide dismutase family protein [Myxococcota bacterium]
MNTHVKLATQLLFALAACAYLPACGSDDDDGEAKTATADITGLGTNTAISGKVTFTAATGKVTITGKVQGFEPGSVHGFHLHQTGDCSDPTGMSAGGHWNPQMHMHGAPASATSHLGDLGNITAGSDGAASISISKSGAVIGDGSAMDVVGRAVIVHAGMDDEMTDPAGNAGARIACGVVK